MYIYQYEPCTGGDKVPKSNFLSRVIFNFDHISFLACFAIFLGKVIFKLNIQFFRYWGSLLSLPPVFVCRTESVQQLNYWLAAKKCPMLIKMAKKTRTKKVKICLFFLFRSFGIFLVAQSDPFCSQSTITFLHRLSATKTRPGDHIIPFWTFGTFGTILDKV